jgi:hypothetical protein
MAMASRLPLLLRIGIVSGSIRSFESEDYQTIWNQLNTHLNVTAVETSTAQTTYPYNWTDSDYIQRQIAIIGN